MTDKLTLAVNHALNDARMARARMGLMVPTMGLDNKRIPHGANTASLSWSPTKTSTPCTGAVVLPTVL